MTRSLWLVVALLASACRAELHQPAEQIDLLRELGPGVHAQVVQGGGVRVLNATTSEIRLVVVNPYWLGLLAPCTDASSHCAHLRPNTEQIVPRDQIHGIDDNPSVLVVRFWRPGDAAATEVSVSRSAGP